MFFFFQTRFATAIRERKRTAYPSGCVTSVTTGAATLASGANYLLVSGLKPRGRLGKRLMIQRENLQERYREREVLVREKMGVGRERMRARQVRVPQG